MISGTPYTNPVSPVRICVKPSKFREENSWPKITHQVVVHPSVCRAGNLPGAPHCYPGHGRGFVENDGEAGGRPGKAPDGGFSVTLLREDQPPTGASHIQGARENLDPQSWVLYSWF